MKIFRRLRRLVLKMMGVGTIGLEILLKIFINTDFILLNRPKK